MTAGLKISELELRELVVDRLEIVTPEEFDAARSLAGRFHLPLERALAERGRVPLKFLLEQLAQEWGLSYTDLKVTNVKSEALQRVREEYARSHMLIPFDVSGDSLSVAMADPRDRRVIAELQRLTDLRITPYLASQDSILRAHLLYRGNLLEMLRQAAEEQSGATLTARSGAEATAPTLLNRILEYAAVTEASDIHIEPYEHETLVRYRIDGVLREVLSMPAQAIMGLAVRVTA